MRQFTAYRKELPQSLSANAGVHSQDLGQIETLNDQAYRERRREYYSEYRIIRGGDIR